MGFLAKKEKRSISFEISSDKLMAACIDNEAQTIKALSVSVFEEDVFQNGYLTNPEEFKSILSKIKSEPNFNVKKASITLPSNIAFMKIINLPVLPFEELCIIVPQEAEKHIPFSIESVNIDFEITKQIKDKEGKVVEYEALLVVIPKDIIKEYVHIFSKVGYELTQVDITSLSAIKSYAVNNVIDDTESLEMSVFMSYEHTDMLILNKGMPIFFYNIPLGKKNILEEMSVAVPAEIDNTQASLLTVDISSAGSTGFEMNEVNTSVKSVFSSIAAEINKVVDFYYSQVPDSPQIETIIVSGSGACIKGIREYLSEKTKINTIICNPIVNLGVDAHADEQTLQCVESDLTMPTFASSIGLALKG